MTLGQRIAFGIILMLILMTVVGAAGYYGLNRVLSVMAFNDNMRLFHNITSLIKEQTDQYQLNVYNAECELANAARQEAFAQLDKGFKVVRQIKNHPV